MCCDFRANGFRVDWGGGLRVINRLEVYCLRFGIMWFGLRLGFLETISNSAEASDVLCL